jgi:energy-coupling factor transporter ATP-binding protein EcfA2
MMIDPVQIVQMGFYSHIMSKVSNSEHFTNPSMLFFFACLYGIYTLAQNEDYQSTVKQWIENLLGYNESSLRVPMHQKTFRTFIGFGASQETTKPAMSPKFLAVLHFLQKASCDKISGYHEIMKMNPARYDEEPTEEYMLLPSYNERILMTESFAGSSSIFLEITIEHEKRRFDHDDSKDKSTVSGANKLKKQYIFTLFTRGKKNMNVLMKYMDDLVKTYEKETAPKVEQKLFELTRSQVDDDDDRTKLVYREFPFHSNKHFDRNIFFEGRHDFQDFLNRFGKTGTHDDLYVKMGVTKKAFLLLHGEPGCGKSTLIKGLLNKTGRHGVMVRWDRLKTCADFCSLFRSPKINGKPFKLEDYIFIFEDFDANSNETLKKRKTDGLDKKALLQAIKTLKKTTKDGDDGDGDGDADDDCGSTGDSDTDPKNVAKQHLTHVLEKLEKPTADELTLECVLNVMDGIAEMPGGMMVFTTNHFEKIDPAFYRSGRIDKIVEFKKASVKIIKEMVFRFFDIGLPDDGSEKDDIQQYDAWFSKMRDYEISTADIQTICFDYGKRTMEECLDALVARFGN